MIDTKALRQKILDLAFQGKLTEQLPEDGTGEELFQQIQQEKQKLEAEGKIKKNKPLSPIDEAEIPFEIPESWKWARWGELANSLQYGYIDSAKRSGQVKMVRISDIHDNKVDWDSVPYCNIDDQDLETYRLYDNDILFARTGGTVGKSYLVSNIRGDAVFAGYLIRTNYSQLLNAKYIKYFMDSQLYWKQLQNGTIATAQPNCNGQTLSKMILPLPPVTEQGRIVALIDSSFLSLDYIDNIQKRYQDNLNILKSKLIDAAIQGKLTEQLPGDGTAVELYELVQQERKSQETLGLIKHEELSRDVSDEEIPFSIPDSWCWTHLGNVSYIVRGGSPRPIKQYITQEPNGINWIKIGDVEKGEKYIYQAGEKIKPEGEKKSRRVRPGDFLLTNSMSFGRPYISQIEGCIHDGWLLIRNLKSFDTDYLYYLLSSNYLYNQFIQKASGSTVDNLNIDKVKSAIIPFPPLAEQKRIVARLEELLPLCE